MTRKFAFKALNLCLSFLLISSLPAEAVDEVVSSGDSQSINLTIYNQNFGVVKDTRTLTLSNGLNYVRFEDVAANIDPTSVSFISLTAPNAVTVREQNYQYDIIDPTTILSKSVGKTIKFMQLTNNGGTREWTGVLINSPRATVSDTDGNVSERSQGLVVKTPEGIILNPIGQIELKELPPGLVAKPSLLWKLETNKPGEHKAEISYQTSNMSWRCDYVAILNAADNELDLTSWVTLDNKSGASYKQASLKLMAGDVHRVTTPEAPPAPMVDMAMEAADGMAPQFKEQSFAEYHLYTLQNKTDVMDQETKQLTLFNAAKIPAQKRFVYEPEVQQFVPMEGGYGGRNAQKVNVKIEVANTEQNHLGMPMPKGKVRVYKKDSDGALQFIGEDMIDHTPRDEKIRLYIGDAFDLVAERKQLNVQQISDRVQRLTYEISLRNHKDSEVTITCVEHAWGDWTIMTSSHPHIKTDSKTFEFNIKVPANGETKLRYEVEQRY
jgi:hypothetical protein